MVPIQAMMRNPIKVTAGQYNTTEITGFWVATQPTADDTKLTGIGATAQLVAGMPKEMFVEGQMYAVHCSEITVGTGGVFYVDTPDD